MTEDERILWERPGPADQAAWKEDLVLYYLPLAIFWAKRVSRIAAWANWEDLRQEGVIGLMKAIDKFDPQQGVPFKAFARTYIRGAIFDSPEITRNLPRQQKDSYRKIKRVEEELTKTLQRIPTIEEVAEKTGLTIEQILNAVEAMSLAFAGELLDAEESPPSTGAQTAEQERAALIHDALSHFSEREQAIIRHYYWDDLPDKEIAEMLGLTLSNATKIRHRTLDKLRRRLATKKQSSLPRRSRGKRGDRVSVEGKGGHDGDRQSGE